MQIYFGAEALDDLISTEGMLVSSSSDTHAFYYGLEFGSNTGGTDEVLIYDGIDREIPVDIENVPALIQALEKAYFLHKTIKMADEIMDEVVKYDSETHIAV